MTVVNVHEAKTHLSRLLARVADGESVVIARAGSPVARLVPIEPASTKRRRIGFMPVDVPDDFDRMGEAELAADFEGGE